MRIALISHKFPPFSVGGTEVYTWDLAKALSVRHEVDLFYRCEALPAQPYSEAQVQEADWRARRVHYSLARRPLARAFFDTFLNSQIECSFGRFLDETKPDVAHFQHLMGLSVHLLQIAHERRVPVVFTLHDYWFLCSNGQMLRPDFATCPTPPDLLACVDCAATRVRLPAYKVVRPLVALPFAYRYAVLRAAAKKVSYFIAPSQFLREQFVAAGYPESRLIYCPNGLDLARIRRSEHRKSADGRLRIVYLGSIAWQKGVLLLSQAIQGLPVGRATFRIYGDPTLFPAYAQEVQEALTHPDSQFMGRLAPDEVGNALADADVLVVPSLWYENDPLVIQEAFAAGVPVVAADIGALAEKVRHEVDGLLFRRGDVLDLQETLGRLIAQPELVERFRRNTRLPTAIDEHAGALEAIYQRAIAAGRSSRAC